MKGLARFGAVVAVSAAVTVGAVLPQAASGEAVLRVTDTASADYHWAPDEPLFVLLLGDDGTDRGGPGGCGCTDAVHLVGVPAGGGSAVMVNIPRDTNLKIPGVGTRRVNVAYQKGGAALAARTVGEFVGVEVSYTVVTTFKGLKGMVDELGGITVDVPRAVDDPNSGAHFAKGPTEMDGTEALAFSRNRKGTPAGDFDRTANQGRVILGALATLRSLGTSPADTIGYLGVLMRGTDAEGVDPTELYRIGHLALSIDPSAVQSFTMPGHPCAAGEASVVCWDPPAMDLFADFADDARIQSYVSAPNFAPGG